MRTRRPLLPNAHHRRHHRQQRQRHLLRHQRPLRLRLARQMTTQPPTGKPNSLTSIAFNTGVIMERQRLARIIKRMARTWKKPTALNYPAMLEALAEQIELGELQ